MTSAAIQALGAGFSEVTIGKAGSGTTWLAGKLDVGSKPSPLRVLGDTVAVRAGAAVTLGGSNFILHGSKTVLVAGNVTSRAATGIGIISTKGAVTMVAGTSVKSLGGHIDIAAANGVAVSKLDADAGKNAVMGRVSIDPGKGALTDANMDAAPDIIARSISLYADVSAPAPTDIVEVATDTVYIASDEGLVLRRESSTDGRLYYSILYNNELHPQLATFGLSRLVTTDPRGSDGNLASVQSTLLPVSGSAAPMLKGDAYLMSLTAKGYNQVELEQAWVLGSPGSQPLANGAASANPVFDYWVETLEL
ncbi:MAG: hypothetical protein EOO24_63445 [Comamonadaceae bacterium]|nr:MAG: hypothetical protein EOO24_63445 [Comamonadaceae bacterium]